MQKFLLWHSDALIAAASEVVADVSAVVVRVPGAPVRITSAVEVYGFDGFFRGDLTRSITPFFFKLFLN